MSKPVGSTLGIRHSDIEILEGAAELATSSCILTLETERLLKCIRVDEASDEGPSHQEVQYWWTVRHLSKGYYAILW